MGHEHNRAIHIQVTKLR